MLSKSWTDSLGATSQDDGTSMPRVSSASTGTPVKDACGRSRAPLSVKDGSDSSKRSGPSKRNEPGESSDPTKRSRASKAMSTRAALDWQHIVATWTRKSLSDVSGPVPLEWRTADVVRGPISEPDPPKNSLPASGNVSQIVAISHRGCEALSASLAMIIWLE
ncbi:hypothetical protein PENPOL_c006G06160 [Penicillium polonicum]|uniref:Uncharacterized protein n=1 Tax=Penicillium polonicum TaxID=60169 RepID=A0A1V6NLM1_PENPO|nr:hypothetical protein PENPOL_c006G06160 [Penicillium polonicum]